MTLASFPGLFRGRGVVWERGYHDIRRVIWCVVSLIELPVTYSLWHAKKKLGVETGIEASSYYGYREREIFLTTTQSPMATLPLYLALETYGLYPILFPKASL